MAGPKDGKKGGRKERLPRIVPDDERKKRTLVLSAATWQRLGAEADRRGVDRSRIAESILARELGHVRISFDGGPVGEGGAAA